MDPAQEPPPEWLDGPFRPGWTDVVRHTPDDGRYHVPDRDQLRGMRGSPVGQFAVVPAARRDGRSRGFDPGSPGVVHVDPLAPDGGVVFDPAGVSPAALKAAVDRSEYPHQAYYALGVPAARLGYTPRGWQGGAPGGDDPPVNPLRPNDYVVPKAAADGRQARPAAPQPPNPYEPPMQPVPPLSSLPPLGPPAAPAQPQPAPPPPAMVAHPVGPVGYQPAPGYPYPPAYPPPAPAPDPAVQQFMHQIVQQMAAMTRQMADIQQGQALPPTTGLSPAPLPVGRPLATLPAEARRPADPAFDETARPIRRRRADADDGEEADEPSLVRRARRQTVDEYEDSRAPSGPAVVAGFETLGIPWCGGPLAEKAKINVVFTLPTGRVQAKFHDVIQGEGCLVLVYDTRFEDGQQYLPPDCGETPITVDVPKLKISKRVLSMNITASLGVFDQVILCEAADRPEAGGDEAD